VRIERIGRRERRLGPGVSGLLVGGALGLLWAGACMGPLPAIGQGPLAPPAPTPLVRAAPTQAREPTRVATQPPAATPTAAPTVRPAPAPSNATLLQAVRDELASQWVETDAETALRGGPDDNAPLFTMLPQWTNLRRLDGRGDWIKVYYGGDGDSRQPGPGWVRVADVGGVPTPPVWLSAATTATLWKDPTSTSGSLVVPPGTHLEVVTPNPIQGTRIHVETPGDGRATPPGEGWVEAGEAARGDAPATWAVPWAFPDVLKATVRLPVRYRTQLDGSAYAGANCGPTALGMALEAFGVQVQPPQLRSEVLVTQDDLPTDDDAGSYIWSLARVAQDHGVRPLGLYEADGATVHHWTVDEIKQQVAAHHPVIAQVRYRYLPRRGDSAYYGDHYIVITGLVGNDLLYDDPIGGPSPNEGPGWDRLMSPEQLAHAMNASDWRYANAAFALTK
jgi:Peptidase_C39 like family